ncbi:hypothetical protein KQ874_02315 [Mycoplasma sp. ES3157-GEN-MYC]|uniref:Uncharacterized protein n=1 Tax=Mycoplasma miroungigenitalium TaxID=754515 RepID=A0A6M4JEV7_9MOLU|nr:hypothetical protein [Mycoplasma miroungigenitalium]MBU4690518.1 hypothetical protein [Mycoplasma miroungigenitalium]MBU4691785.1 hypothetical protein [Mycoplasma miroungigenitalium]QJR43612.1 hypothetical protein HLA87_02320 [Mycoplasma miroungigenitalium]
MSTQETKKPKLNRFYLSEKYDENRNISFNLKRAKVDELINFKTFKEGVNEFNRIAFTLEGNSRVWFHKDGAFRGSATPEKTAIMIERVTQENVKDEDAIEFINREKLIDVAPVKTKKVEPKPETVAEPKLQKPTVDLNKEVTELIVYIEDKETKLPSEVSLDDVKAETKYEFVPTSVKWTDDSVVVTYLLRDGDTESNEVTSVIRGFKAKPTQMRTIYRHFVERTQWSKITYWLLSVVFVIAILCIIVLVLHAYGLISIPWSK